MVVVGVVAAQSMLFLPGRLLERGCGSHPRGGIENDLLVHTAGSMMASGWGLTVSTLHARWLPQRDRTFPRTKDVVPGTRRSTLLAVMVLLMVVVVPPPLLLLLGETLDEGSWG